MGRTLDPILQDGLDNNKGSPFFTAYLWTGASYTQVQPTAYELFNLTAKVTFVYSASLLSTQWFYISRGLRINGVNYPVASSKYYRKSVTSDLRTFITIEAHIFDNLLVSTPGDVAANTALAAAMTQTLRAAATAQYQNTITYPAVAPWWKTIKFYPTGRTLKIKAQSIPSLLRQKYLVQLCEVESNQILALSSSQFEEAFVRNFNPNQVLTVERIIEYNKARKFIWRDENATLHTNGIDADPLFNMGYIESTVDPTPAFGPISQSIEYVKIKFSMPDLSITNGDAISIDNDVSIHILVKETFDINKEPAWYMELIPVQWVLDTEGGQIPSTIEAAAPYTPLNVSYFDSVLSSNDNNIQAAMDTLDDHTHSGLATTEGIQDLIGAMVSGNTETGIAVTYDDTNGKLDFVAEVTQAELDAHTGDTTDAHDASAISIVDTNDYFVATQVEDALQEATGKIVTGWNTDADTWTRSNNYIFTVSGDKTTRFRKGTKIRVTNGGTTKYGVVGSSSYSNPTTTVNLIPNTDYLLAAGSLTAPSYSYIENPEGFPHWFNYTPTYSGSGSMTYTSVSTTTAIWNVIGNTLHIYVNATGTTGGTASISLQATLPVAPQEGQFGAAVTRDATSGSTVLGAGLSDTTNAIVRKSDASNYGLGTGRILAISLTLRI